MQRIISCSLLIAYQNDVYLEPWRFLRQPSSFQAPTRTRLVGWLVGSEAATHSLTDWQTRTFSCSQTFRMNTELGYLCIETNLFLFAANGPLQGWIRRSFTDNWALKSRSHSLRMCLNLRYRPRPAYSTTDFPTQTRLSCESAPHRRVRGLR